MVKGYCSVRPEVAEFTPYSPGLSIDEIREKYGLERVIKLASNENPLGASPVVKKVIAERADLVFRYAQSGNPGVVRAIAEHHGVGVDEVVIGNGSDEVIDLLVRVRAEPGRHNAAAFRPCFSLYGLQSRLCGVDFRQAPLNEDFSFNWKGLKELVDGNTRLVFVTTPDNPSGYCPPVEELLDFAAWLPPDCLLVADEAYMDFCADEAAHSVLSRRSEAQNIAVLRTFSKSFGLAGLRLGYGIMPAALADYLRRVRPPFSVNILAAEAGMAALKDREFRRATLETVRRERAGLSEALAALGCKVYPSGSNFIMFAPPAERGLTAWGIFESLLAAGIIIRPLKSYGLPGHLRVSVGNEWENREFLKALQKLFNGA